MDIVRNQRSSWKKRFLVSGCLLQLFCAYPSYAGFVNGGFESPYTPDNTSFSPITGWTQTGYHFPGTGPSLPTNISSIGLTVNATPISDIIIGTTQTLYDYFLFGANPTPTQTVPIIASQSAMINLRSIDTPLTKSGTGNPGSSWTKIAAQATALSQQVTIQPSDLDPTDGKYHIRFIAAPVVENPTHAANQQPFVAFQVNNITTGRTGTNPLFFQWNYGGQPGVPWSSLSAGAGTNPGSSTDYQYTVLQAFDIAPGNAFIHVGDTIELVALASGCSPGGHDGHMYLDGASTSIPYGLWVVANGPISSTPGNNVTYTYTYTNTSIGTINNVQVVANLPLPQTPATPTSTTYVSNTTPTVGTSPSCAGTGPVTCNMGTLTSGQSGTFQLTVNIPSAWATTVGPVNNGNYPISGTPVSGTLSPLLGPLVQTTLVAPSGLSNLVVNASGLPTTGTVGTPYTGTFTCANTPTSSATGDAPSATCDITNLPAGLSETGCTITPSGAWVEPTTIPSGQTVTCTVAGTPTTVGAPTSTVSSNATNNSNSTTNSTNVTISIASAQYTVTPGGDSNENISPSTPQTVNSGSTQNFTVTANTGYTLSSTVGGTCPAGSFSGSVYTTGAITSSCSVSFSASINQYTVTPGGDSHEAISPSTPQTVNYGGTQAFTVTANTGYTLSNTVGGTCPAGSWTGNQYTTGAITGSCSVSFSASINSYTLTPSGDGNETISPNTPQTVNYGGTQAFTVTPNAHYTLSNTVGGTCPAGSWTGNQYTTGAITGSCSVSFSASINQYTITPSGDGNETISPSTPQTVNYGGTQVFTITPNTGFTLSNTVSGTCPAGSWSGNQYTTGTITSSCSVRFGSLAMIPATLNGSAMFDPAVVCCGRPLLLGPLPIPGSGPTTYAVTASTGNVSCFIGTSGSQTYFKMDGSSGSCTIVGTKNGVSSAPFTVVTPF